MKRSIFLISIFLSLVCSAQRLKVTSFNIQPQDLTARDQPRVDNDGVLGALMKISVLDKITKVEGTVLGDIVSDGVEKWVYVTDKTKKIKLHFENHFPLMIVFEDYNFPSAQEKMVYEVTLEEENGQPAVANVSTPVQAKASTPAPVTTPTASTQDILAEAKNYFRNKEFEKAMELFRKIDGDKEAQNRIGVMYSLGRGVSQNYQEAARWFLKAAEQGDALSQSLLGDLYARGTGVSLDYQEAVRWYRKAAEQGDALGQAHLGNMYYVGKGVAQDYQEAARWYRKSAEQGFELAQSLLGNMYAEGKGVSQDYQEAVSWWRKAAAQGNEDAKKALKQLGY